MSYPKVKTQVVFKMFPSGEVLAIFPHEVADHRGNRSSYMHLGQHGAALPALLVELPDATPGDYEELFKELETIGYNLEVL